MAQNENATYVVIDWVDNGVSCCSFFELTFCYPVIIPGWVANRLIVGSKNGFFGSIENVIGMGHSLGGQYIGYFAQAVFKAIGRKFLKLISLDAAGPLYEINGIGQCQGVYPDLANYTMAFHTSPYKLGTGNFGITHRPVFFNKNEGFCQYNTSCDIGKCHTYAHTPVIKLLAHKVVLNAFYSTETTLRPISIYDDIPEGTYNVEAVNNTALLNPSPF